MLKKIQEETRKWTKFIEEYEQSGTTKTGFCKKNKVPISKFYYWLAKLRPEMIAKKQEIANFGCRSDKKYFIPIKTINNKSEVEIKLNSGIALSMTTLPSGKWMAEFIKELEISHVCIK